MSNFDYKPFTELLNFIVDNRGKSVPLSSSGTIPLIKTESINNENLHPTITRKFLVSEEIYHNWFRSHPQRNDIIVVNKGSYNGAVCLVPNPVNFCIAQDMVAVRPNKDIVDPLFLLAALRSPNVQAQIKNLNVSSAIPHFKKTDFDKLLIPYPPRNIQEQIGKFYYNFSKKIELNQQMNQTLEAIARAIFKSWFVDFDPVRAKMEGKQPVGMDTATANLFPDSFEESELGLIPRGWRVGTIDKCTSLIIDYRGKTPKKLGGDWTDEGIPAISAKNIKAGKMVRKEAIRYVNQELFKKWMKDTLAIGDIITTSEAPLGELFYLARNANYCLSQRLYGIRANEKICKSIYLYYALASEDVQLQLENRATGTTVVGIRQTELRKVEILLPPIEIQNIVAKTLETFMIKIHSNDEQSETLANIRDILLPKLMSGEIRVKEAERMIEEVV